MQRSNNAMMSIVQAEKDNSNLNDLPITRLLFEFLDTIDHFEEKKPLKSEDWIKFYGILKSHSKKAPLSNIIVENLP